MLYAHCDNLCDHDNEPILIIMATPHSSMLLICIYNIYMSEFLYELLP